MMQTNRYSTALVIDILRKEYPEIETRIHALIDNTVPEKLDDLEMIPQIISSFKSLKGINHSSWTNKAGVGIRNEMTENRDLLLSVIMLFYHPEKIMQLTTDKARYKLMGKVADALHCKTGVLKVSLSSVIVAFKAYRSFREETFHLYKLIKAEHNLFN